MAGVVLALFACSYILIINLTQTQRIHIATELSADSNAERQSEKLVFLPSRELKPPKLPLQKRSDLLLPHPFELKKRPHMPKVRQTSILADLPQINGPVTLVGAFRRPKVKQRTSTAGVSKFDPFYKFMPSSPQDVNQMVLEQDDEELKKAKQMYQQIVTASRHKFKDHPFQLMLDVFPMHNQASPSSKKPNVANRFSPYAAKYNAMNSVHQEKAYTTYFNKMAFPQIQPRNPYAKNDPELRDKVLGNGASQLIVHLNLYPKKKKKRRYPSKSPEEYNEYFRRSDENIIENDFPYKFETPPQFKPLLPLIAHQNSK